MKLIISALAAVLIMSGCASQDYALYADSVQKSDVARYKAESAKYKAMSDIASSGTEAAKVAAVMALALGNQQANQTTKLQAPKSSAETALQWVGVLAPTIVQAYAIKANTQLGMNQSDNATRVAESTNSAFVGIAGKIQAPAANVSTTTTDNHAVSLSGTGSLGSGSYSTNANPTTTTDSHNVSTPTSTDSHNVSTPPTSAP